MSQQNKIIFVACVFSALVAVALGQAWNLPQCLQAQQSITSFTQQMSGTFQDFIQKLSNEGNSAIDINGFSADVSKLLALYTSMANTENFDSGNTLTTLTKIAQQQFKMSQYFLNFQVGPRVIRLYINLTQKMMADQGELVSNLVSACGPTRGTSPSN